MKRAVFVLWVLVTAHRIYTSPWIHRGGRAADGRDICKQLSLPSVGGETLIGLLAFSKSPIPFERKSALYCKF